MIRSIRNSVYDPMYEAMGLPVDPHLRMFIRRDNDGMLQISINFHIYILNYIIY